MITPLAGGRSGDHDLDGGHGRLSHALVLHPGHDLHLGILPRAGGRGRAGVCIISMVVVQRSVLCTMIGQVLTRLFVKSLSSLVRERCRLV